jgi:hypothetical protein
VERHGERFEPGRRRGGGGGGDGGSGAKPTVRQIYAVARALCARCGEEFPETRTAASALIERLRGEGSGEREAA